ncbi:MAG: T9SS type A sorting domain-containing protein [Bacteroidetes bacterium]|nr:T9SS type A sorting domain-containing protein [Bacteroidota bacterium]
MKIDSRISGALAGVIVIWAMLMNALQAQQVSHWETVYPNPGSDTTMRSPSMFDITCIDDSRCFVAMNNGLLATTDGGEHWNYTELIPDTVQLLKPLRAITVTDDGTLWTCGWYGALFRSTDNGETWEDRSLAPEYDMEDIHFIDADIGWIAGDSSDVNNSLGKGCILKTTNGGEDWFIASLLLPDPPDAPFWVTWMGIQFVSRKVGYAVGRRNSVARSDDGGLTWNLFYPLPTYTERFSVFAHDEDRVFVGGDQASLLWSDNGGVDWYKDRVGSTVNYDIHFIDDEVGIIVGSNGVAITGDGGRNWTADPLPEGGDHRCRAVFVSDQYAWVVTEGGEIYRRSGGRTLGLNSSPYPMTMSLHAFPSPLSLMETGKVHLTTPEATDIDVALYDMLGRHRATVWSGHLSRGVHILSLRAPATAGVYFLRAHTTQNAVTRSLMVVH